MKKRIILALALILSVGLLVGATKKDKKKGKKAVEAPAPVVLPTCGFSKIVLSPDRVNDPQITVGAGKEVKLIAKAYDGSGKQVPANLVWYFRGLPEGEKLTTSDGHKLTASGDSAVFSVSGMAAGNFKIAAESSGCLDADQRPIRGVSELEVYPAPGEPAHCGPILVMYGQREITNERLLGYLNFILRAEVYGPKKLQGYKIQFFLEGKKVEPLRGLIYNKTIKPGFDQEASYWNYVPAWLPAGAYAASYQLLKDKKVVCESTNTYFTAR